MDLGDLTEDQWTEIALRLIFDLHPFPTAIKVMTLDRVRSEEFGMAIQRFGGIAPLVAHLSKDNTLPQGMLQDLAEMLVSSKDDMELRDRVAASHRRAAASDFMQANPDFVWSKVLESEDVNGSGKQERPRS